MDDNPSTKNRVLNIIDRFEKELKGSLTTLIILLIIQKEKTVYGYKIKKELQLITKDDEMITDSTLYTSLRSLESKYQLIQSMVHERRVYYSLTDEGNENIQKLLKFWNKTQITTNTAISKLLGE
jgi:DNA-binding PadR family transcriptional regulator